MVPFQFNMYSLAPGSQDVHVCISLEGTQALLIMSFILLTPLVTRVKYLCLAHYSMCFLSANQPVAFSPPV